MGYTNLRYFVGGMAEWSENGGPMEQRNGANVPLPNGSSVTPITAHRLSWLETIANLSLERLIAVWFGMILVFGLIYWIAGVGMGMGLQAGANLVKADVQ